MELHPPQYQLTRVYLTGDSDLISRIESLGRNCPRCQAYLDHAAESPSRAMLEAVADSLSRCPRTARLLSQACQGSEVPRVYGVRRGLVTVVVEAIGAPDTQALAPTATGHSTRSDPKESPLVDPFGRIT